MDKDKSLHQIQCERFGLDHKTTSLHAIECVMLGLDPNTTSIAELDKKRGFSKYVYTKT